MPLNPHEVTTTQLTYTGAAVAAGGVAVACATATTRRELLRELARLSVVVGTGLAVAAQARRRPIDEKRAFRQGYTAGFYDGRKKGKPVVVPIHRPDRNAS